MQGKIIILQVAIILLVTGCRDRDPLPEVTSLLCENLENPVGIGTTSPCLSWKIISSVSGTSQTSYQIIAATSLDLLDEEKCDLWNSDRVPSAESVLVPYQGKPLSSRSVCYWKVRIWDDKGNISRWSDTAFFSIGLKERDDWKADPIVMPDDFEDGVSPQMWQTFEIGGIGERIFLYVNSFGYHEVYLNGEKVGCDVLSPSVSQFDKRSQVLTYDLTSIINDGKNDIIIWAGRGWYSQGLPGVKGRGPIVKAQMEQFDNGRWNVILKTDTSWRCRRSGYYTTGNFRPGQFGGERVIGELLVDDLSPASLNSVSWNRVKTAQEPAGIATPQMTEPNRITDTICPLSVQQIRDGEWLADMGTTLTGWTRIKFPLLQRGQEIIMEFCDHLDKDGMVVDQGQTDYYIAAGTEGESFCNKFNYHGFRYIKISNLPQKPAASDITGFLIQTGFRQASSFKCSDPDLNSIHDMISYTLRCLSLGGYLVDCPQIERLGYGGDGNASTETAQIMYNLAPLYSNWLQAWADCIRDDGSMPHTAPNPYSAGGGPYWCGFIITASWRTYQNYGDIRFLERYYPEMKKWLSFVEKHSPDGLLRKWPETDYRTWYLGDWASPEGTDHTNPRSIDVVNNCFIVICYETMVKIAQVLGREYDAEKFNQKKDDLRSLIHKEFYSPDTFTYGSGTQIDLTYPLLAGVVPDSLYSQVRNNLYNLVTREKGGHIATGLVGVPVFTEWAVKNREAGFMYSILKKRSYPGYLYMIDNGAATTWEHWNGARSRIHNCYNGIGSWFYHAPGGIYPDEHSPGYRHFFIEPQIPDSLTWAEIKKETPYGEIALGWKLRKGKLQMEIKIPPGCTATLNIPEYSRSYRLNGEKFKTGPSAVELESGHHLFRLL